MLKTQRLRQNFYCKTRPYSAKHVLFAELNQRNFNKYHLNEFEFKYKKPLPIRVFPKFLDFGPNIAFFSTLEKYTKFIKKLFWKENMNQFFWIFPALD